MVSLKVISSKEYRGLEAFEALEPRGCRGCRVRAIVEGSGLGVGFRFRVLGCGCTLDLVPPLTLSLRPCLRSQGT